MNLSKIPYVPLDFYNQSSKGFVKHKDILVCKDGALTGKTCLVDFSLFKQKEVMINEHVFIVRSNENKIKQNFLFYILHSKYVQNQIKDLAYSKSAQPGLNKNHIERIMIPLPPIEEQEEIITQLEEIENQIIQLENTSKVLKAKRVGIYGKTENSLVKLKDILTILRGGSPRPIDQFITTNPDGINWLKIGDIQPEKKYIYTTKEKIKKEGLKYSRLAKVGDFILSNSMSFGRPYIMKTEACIHDG